MFEVVEPFGFKDIVEILKITAFFAVGYGVAAFVGFVLVNLLFFKKDC